MKKFRPLNAGYILTYAVVALCIIQGIWIIISMILRQNAQNSATGMLDMWSLILVPVAVVQAVQELQAVEPGEVKAY